MNSSKNSPSGHLRVLIIAPSSAGMIGGQEVEAALLVRRWQNDPQVEAIFVANNPALPTWLRKLGRIRYLRTAVRLPVYLALVCRAAGRVDVLHVFSASYSSFLMNCLPVWLISRLQRKQLVLNYHTARGWTEFASSRLVRFVLKRSEEIVVPSAYLEGKFAEIGFSSKVVPNIIDEDRMQYRPRNRPRPILICTRNLSWEYGIEVIIRAFALVQRSYPDATLYLLGSGPRWKALEALVRALSVSGIVFCGAIPNEEMAKWYARADVFVNASLVDNSPLSLLEAMACGVPIVTTAAGGIPCMVKHGETALVCPIGDSQTMAEQVMRLLGEPGLALEIAHRAHEKVSLHRWSSVREKWLDAYRNNRRDERFRTTRQSASQ